MTLSMYGASVPVLSSMLSALSHVLTKAEADATTRKIDPSVLLNDRLAPDMFPLKKQVQVATDFAKSITSRLAGTDIPAWPDSEESFAELQARIAKALEFIGSFTPGQIDGSEAKTITLQMRAGEMSFAGQDYLLGFALPNFYFHVTTAYNILRHNGVPLGKADFFGRG
jgi:hypothetical protein